MAPRGWATSALGEVIELKRGYDLPSRDRRVGAYPIVSSSGVSGYHAEARAKAPGVVIGRYGTLGEVHYITQDYWPLNTSLYVRDFKGNDPRFISYFLRSLDFSAYSDKAAVPGLNRNDLHTAEVRVPPLAEQRTIAHILGTFDDRIELNGQMNEALDAIVRTLFTSWFVAFDPVRAKAEGREPRLPAQLGDLFPDSLYDSQLGLIPKGWHVSRLGDVLETLLGGTPSRAEPRYWGGDVPWINSGKANEFRIVEPTEYITKAGLGSSATKMLPARTTVIAITGATLGQVSVTEIATAANQSIVGVVGSVALPTEFVYHWVTGRLHDLVASATGGAQQHINKNNVNDLLLLCPSGPVIAAYVALARPIFDRIRNASVEARSLATLRDNLLPKLMTGQIGVGTAEELARTGVL